MNKRVLFFLICLALCVHSAVAATFEIDYRGARPKDFRVTALCKGLDHFMTPEPYKSTLFNSEGKHIMGYGTGLYLGIKDGKTFLVQNCFGSSKDVIIGAANNLDDIRPFQGIVFKGWQEWDMLSHAWRFKVDSGQTKLAIFDGKQFDIPCAVDRLIENIRAGGKKERPENLMVLMSFLEHYFNYFGPNEEYSQLPASQFFTRIKSEYIDRVAAAASQFQGDARKRLAQLNEEVQASAEATLASYQKSDIKYPKMIDVLKMAVKAIDDLQNTLTK